jgi:hypothetical protein
MEMYYSINVKEHSMGNHVDFTFTNAALRQSLRLREKEGPPVT